MEQADFQMASLVSLPLAKLVINDKWNVRLDASPKGSDQDGAELLASVRENGVLQPIDVADNGDGKFRVLSGFRRVHAALVLSLPNVPAIVHADGDARRERLINLTENIARESLLPVELARGLADWAHGLPPHGRAAAAAKAFGMDPKWTARLLRCWAGAPDLIAHWQQYPHVPINKIEAVLTLDKPTQLPALLRSLKTKPKDNKSESDEGEQAEKAPKVTAKWAAIASHALALDPTVKGAFFRLGVETAAKRLSVAVPAWKVKPAKVAPTKAKKTVKRGGRK
jgi:ParB/RepB/Spo0J family partition protein